MRQVFQLRQVKHALRRVPDDVGREIDDQLVDEVLGEERAVQPEARFDVHLVHPAPPELARRGTNEVHVEAGYKLNGSLLRENLVDELVVYLAPHIIGDTAQGMFHLPELEDLSARRELELTEVRTVGSDIRVIARVTRSA